jgi:large subunit ribosomal protein L18
MRSTNRQKRHKRIRRKISGTEAMPRLAVYRSNKHLEIQLINDDTRTTLVGMSTKSLKESKSTKTDKAIEISKLFAEKVKALENGKFTKIVFDRGGYMYHGRVKAIAETLRECGLIF